MSEGLVKLYATVVTGVFALAVVVTAILWPDANVERQTDVQFVTMAIAILAEEVKDQAKQRPLREWAIEIINEHSTVAIGDSAKNALLEEAWPLEASYYSFSKFPPGSQLPPGWWWEQQQAPLRPHEPVPPE